MDEYRIRNLTTNRLNSIKRISPQLRAGTLSIDNIEIPNEIVWNNYTNRFVLNNNRNRVNIIKQERLRRNKLFDDLTQNKEINVTFNNRTGEVINKIKFLNNLQSKLSPNKRFIITLSNGKIFTINPNNIDRIKRIIREGFENVQGSDSDNEIYQDLISLNELKIEELENATPVINGAFFPYLHTCPLMTEYLKRLDIHFSINTMKNIKFKDESYTENCLIRALISSGKVSEELINSLKWQFKSGSIPQKSLKEIAEKNDLYITVRRDESSHRLRKYGDSKNAEIKLGLIEEHYFLIENTPYTSYAVENYHSICHQQYWQILSKEGNRIQKRANRTIDSYALVKKLIDNKDTHLRSMKDCNTDFQKTEYFNEKKEITSLEFTDADVELTEYKPKEPKENIFVEFADFETFNMNYTDKPNKWYSVQKNYKTVWDKHPNKSIHKPFMLCVWNDKFKQIDTYITEKCGKKYLENRVKLYGVDKADAKNAPTLIIYAHNAGYDSRFLEEHIKNLEKIENGHSLICASGKYVGSGKVINIQIRDSYKLISSPLRKFFKMFKMEVEKEYMPYLLYTLDTVSNGYMNYDEVKQFASNEGKLKELEECVEKSNSVENGKFDMLKYAEYYCKRDVEVLQKGFTTFAGWVKEALDIDVIQFYTIPSIAHEYFMREGCYDDTYALAGVVREFINKCLLGGRTMLKNNEKQVVDNRKVADFDAVSLYPSAMRVMRGFLKGKPKIIDNTINWRSQDGFFVELKVINIGKHRQFPMMNIMTTDGTRKYTDKIDDFIGNHIYVDREMLSILEDYHQIEYELVRGYYFDEGHNDKINDVIKEVFKNRLFAKNETILKDGKKKEWTYEECVNEVPKLWFENNKDKVKSFGNDIETVWKLTMNSGYGKSITKPHDTKDVYIKGEDNLKKHIYRHYNWVIESTVMPCEWNDAYKVKQIKPINKHFNYCHIGIEILSQSKRIMSDVMYLAEDKKINMYYTDTDSIHMDLDQVEKLGDLYTEKYGKQLIGNDMGQFHTDFDLDGCKDIYSKKFIGLGKKCYIDHLVGIDKKTGKEKQGHHIRLKGVPEKSIMNVVHKQFGGDPMKLYEKLHKGEAVSFDLTKGYVDGITDIQLPAFEFHSNLLISNREKFERVLKF